jgi:hypothetical protein
MESKIRDFGNVIEKRVTKKIKITTFTVFATLREGNIQRRQI